MMARTTGPILAAGAITWANETYFQEGASFKFDQSARLAVATGMAAGFLYLVERITPDLGVALAWAALATVLLVPIGGSKDSPATNALKFIGL